jgi:PPOX class probable F420-dependent enzyme
MVPESFRELLESPGVAVISTIGPNGTPHSSAVWYLLDDDGKVRLSLNGKRRKLQNLQRDPRVSVLFIDPTNPDRTLELRGRARLAVDEDRSFRDRVGEKYDHDVAAIDGPDDIRYIVTLEPVRVREWPPPKAA